MNEAELEVVAFVTIHWNSCLTLPSPFPPPSLMPSGLGQWNVVLGNNSIALIISLHNRGKPPLSEHGPIVEGWCNLMWHENSSSIFLSAAFLETARFHPADASGLHCFTPLSPSFLSHSVPAHPAVTHFRSDKGMCVCVRTLIHVCARRYMSAESRRGCDRRGNGAKWDGRGKGGDRDMVRSRWRVCDLYSEDLSVKSICV